MVVTIHNSPLILSKWTPYVSLNKNEVTKVLVWIKLRKIPLVAYSEDGLRLIATQVGKPIMLDAFTSQMCSESWGRIGYAHALVEISAMTDLKSEVSMAVLIEEGEGYTMEVISVEYEWKPPHCTDCQVFGHTCATCPKCKKTEPTSDSVDEHKDGFTKVTRKKKKGNKAGGRFVMPQSTSYQPKKDVERKSDSLKAKEGVSNSEKDVAINASIHKSWVEATCTPVSSIGDLATDSVGSRGGKNKSSIGSRKKNFVFCCKLRSIILREMIRLLIIWIGWLTHRIPGMVKGRKECPKSSRSNNQKAFIGGAWSDSGEDEEEKAKDETCLVAQASNEICLGINLEPNEWI
ncbi:reverse transcriptase domain-containing protein, partial [Tanacetum coccineum]